MGLSYLLFKGIDQLNQDDLQTLTNLISDMMPSSTIKIEGAFLDVIKKDMYDYDFSDFIRNTNAEFFSDMRLYESGLFTTFEALKEDISFKKMTLLFDTIYTNDRHLFYYKITSNIDDSLRKQILKDFYEDEAFLLSIKTFIEKNQNTSEASKYLYLHRNTLINRIEKFKVITGYDLKQFEDAAIIYLLIKDIK